MNKRNVGLVYSVSYPYYWIIFRVVSVVAYYVIGARFYYETENWTVIDSVYFVTVSVATIGYGDYHPTNNSGRIFTAFFLVAGLVFVLTAVDDLAKYGVVRVQNDFLAYISPNSTSTERSVAKLFMSLVALFALGLTGVMVLTINEEWSGAEAFYWTICTMATVGYGDLEIKKASSRLFCIFFIACCVLVYAATVHNINEYHALTVLPHYITDGSQNLPDSSYPSSSVSGDLELQPRIPAPSFTSRVKSLLAASARIIKPSTQNEFQPVLSYDPLETELDTLPPACITSNSTIDTAAAARVDSNYDTNTTMSSSNNSSYNNSAQPSPLSTHTEEHRRRIQTVAKNSILTPNLCAENKDVLARLSGGKAIIADEMHPEDATLSLLAVLEQLHSNSEMSADIAGIRQKYQQRMRETSSSNLKKSEAAVR